MFRPRQRRRTGHIEQLVERFRQRGATSPETAQTTEQLGLPPEFGTIMSGHLGKLGIFKETSDNKYYLSEKRLEEIKQKLASKKRFKLW